VIRRAEKRQWGCMNKSVNWLTLCAWLFALCSFAEAQQAIFLVRHAEQDGRPSVVDDPALTEVGHRRAQALAQVLKDAGINVIYTNERRRSIQTAEPISKLLNIESKRLPVQDPDGLIARLRIQHLNDRVLVVSGSLTLPRLLKAVGYPIDITIAEKEYNNLFVIVPKSDGSPLVLRLRY
jgi:phosphohistidine phosphatase SixA